MGSVIDYEECTQCGGVYYLDYNYRSGNEYGVCYTCGKTHHVSLLFSEDNKIMFDENGKWKYEREQKQGFGVCRLRFVEGNGQLIAFIELPATDTINELLAMFNDESVDSEYSYLTVWAADNNCIKALFGQPPNYAVDFGEASNDTNEQVCNSGMQSMPESTDELLPF